MSVVDDIKSRLDIVEVIGAYAKLTRAGRNFKGLSPFRTEKTPSFFVFPDTQTFKDFSSGEQGDVFGFLMKKEGWTFAEALRELAARTGVQLEQRTDEQKKNESHEERLRAACAQAAAYFHRLLLTAPQAANCRKYITESRHLTDATIETWQMGYSLMSYEALMSFLTEKGFTAEELIDAGLVIENEEGRRYDRFRGRLMIPIHDEKGRVVGFGSRSLDGSEPKYMNSPQTLVFDKGRLLFGLNRARQAIRTQQHSVIVEGYMDVIGTHQAGFANVVSGMGTSLTEDQLKMLKRLSDRIVLALDPDAAGNRAVLRSIDVARESLERGDEISFDPRGYVRHESKLNADIRVAIMPDERDPDEVVLESPEVWRNAIANAKPVVEHVMDVTLSQFNINDPRGKSDAVNAIAPILRDLTNPVQRDHHTQELARKLRLNARAVAQAVEASAAAIRQKEQAAQRRKELPRPAQNSSAQMPEPPDPFAEMETAQKSRASGRQPADLELHLLAVLFRKPHLLMDLNVALARANLPALAMEDFSNPALRDGFRQISRAAIGGLGDGAPDDEWIALIADYALDADPAAPASETRLREEGVGVALRLREENLKRDHAGAVSMIEAAQQDGDADMMKRYNFELRELAAKRLRVQKALRLRGGHAPGE
ncbi:MAG TPA: DNA primase [Thermoflexales bacterium]|nr:DNA primase [Thermoflexales bacterium]